MCIPSFPFCFVGYIIYFYISKQKRPREKNKRSKNILTIRNKRSILIDTRTTFVKEYVCYGKSFKLLL